MWDPVIIESTQHEKELRKHTLPVNRSAAMIFFCKFSHSSCQVISQHVTR